MGNEKPYIVIWRERAEQLLGWESSDTWSSYDFEKLSDLVYEKTNTTLSVSTLKRIWEKVKYDSNPTIITLNALAGFLGLADWRAFKKQVDDEKELVPSNLPESRPCPAFKPSRFAWSLSAAIFLILVIGFCAYHYYPFSATGTSGSVSFSAHIISDQMPNSVVFDYNANPGKTDSVIIQQSWDPRRREQVQASGNRHTSIYYYPGYFNAKLLVGGKIIRQTPVFIKTSGWMGIIDKLPVPIYLNNDSITKAWGLGIDASLYARLVGSPVFNGTWSHFYNVRDFKNVNGNDFQLAVSLRNTSATDQSSCKNATIEIMGTEDAITIPLSGKGCIASLDINAGNTLVSGKDHDLSALGCDFTNSQQMVCTVDSGILKLTLNHKMVFSMPFSENIGNIIGLCISFEGPGLVKEVQLGNKRGSVYKETF